MKTYTEKEINEYFEYLKKQFKNSPFYDDVWAVQHTMFNKEGIHNIDEFLEKTT